MRLQRVQESFYGCVLCWVHCGWMLGGYQSCSVAPFLRWAGERKYNERLMGPDKGEGRSLSSYCRVQNRLSLNKLILLTASQNQSRIMINKTKSFPHSSLLTGLNFTPDFLYLLPQSSIGMGNGGCSQFITCCLCHSFFFRGELLTVFPCSSVEEIILSAIMQCM